MPKPQRGRARQSPNSPRNPSRDPTSARRQGAETPRSASLARRPTYPEAVARYEAGVRALQQRQFQKAAEAFKAVLTQYPEEKELNDRVRLYLAVCERHLQSEPVLETAEERLYAATLALNAGDSNTALRHLDDVIAGNPDHDGALYMLGVVHSLRDDPATALDYLRRAIQCNPENRALALQDTDLERLMQDEAIRAAVEATPGRQVDARATSRTRSMR